MTEVKEIGIGNHSEPEEWLSLYGDELFYFALSRVRNRELAEDLVQDTLVSGVKNFATFEGRSAVKTWLISILRNKIIDAARRKKTEQRFKEEIDASVPEKEDFNAYGIWNVWVSNWASRPDELYESEGFKAALLLCLQSLPEKLRQSILMNINSTMDTAAICKELDVSTSSYWVSVHRARMALRKCLDTSWAGKNEEHGG